MPGPVMLDIAGLQLDAEDRELLRHPLVGGVILFARNYVDREQVTELIRSIRELRSPELLIAVDQEGGRVQRFRDGFTLLPPLQWFGRLYDADPRHGRHLALAVARLMAIELLAVGVDFSFAPVVDLDYGRCDVIGDRALHRRPEVVSALALAWMQGMRQSGMAAVAKHFPGHGSVSEDSHLSLPEDQRKYSDILDDIQPYRTLIDDGLRAVMMAHIVYPAVDRQVASLSTVWINSILRGDLGFNGAVFSDDLNMAGAKVAGDVPDRARVALDAGSDMILICNNRPAVGPSLDAIAHYRNPAAQGRLAAMRAVRARYDAAPYQSADWQALRARLDVEVGQLPLGLGGDEPA